MLLTLTTHLGFVRVGEMVRQSRVPAALAEALGWVLSAYMAVLNCHSSSGAPILLSSLGTRYPCGTRVCMQANIQTYEIKVILEGVFKNLFLRHFC